MTSGAPNMLHFRARAAAECYLMRLNRPAPPFHTPLIQCQFIAHKYLFIIANHAEIVTVIVLPIIHPIESLPSGVNRDLSTRGTTTPSLRPFPVFHQPIESVLPDQNRFVFTLLPLSEPVAYAIWEDVIGDLYCGINPVRVDSN